MALKREEIRSNGKQLYTAAEVKKERRRLYDLQGGIDPIILETVDFNQTTCDHDHSKHNTRAALHRQTNAFEGRVVNAYTRGLKWLTKLELPTILRNLADYLEGDYSGNPLHPGWLKAMQTKFNSLNEAQKKQVLKKLLQPEGGNSKERKSLFRKALLTRQFSMQQVDEFISAAKT